ncbi:T9SS C-terminal target domain-containing protein [Candidatus Marinimicrobia bacterium PRS2]|nr:T9SS C-terminal target domain-containing protein [Candidatus Marinimicrobia bacterium PRS2]
MLGKNITIRGIFIAILFITMGVSQVSLEIKNVDTEAGTLDIYITSAAACSFCPVDTYNNNSIDWFDEKDICEENTDTTWVSYDNSYTEAECWNTCSGVITEGTCTGADDPAVAEFSQPDNEADCLDPAGDNNATGTPGTWVASSSTDYPQPFTELDCSDPNNDINETGTPGTWSQSTIVPSINGNGGWWFDGEVGGFQFKLPGVAVTGASGGMAEDSDFLISISTSIVLGFSLSGTTIPSGYSGLLTQVSFTAFEGNSICFGEDTGSGGSTAITGLTPGLTPNGDLGLISLYLGTDWGGCYCVTDSDGDEVCDTDDNCPAEINSNQLDTDGDGAGDACDTTCPYDANNDSDDDGVCECTLSDNECTELEAADDNCPGTKNGSGDGEDNQLDTDGDGAGDACDECINDEFNDVDGDGVCYCTLDDCSAVTDIDNCRLVSNPLQENSDGDTLGDACDNCPGVDNERTDCDEDALTPDEQCDADGDDVGDACDNCPGVDNPNQEDTTEITAGNDPDFVGDACDVCADFDDSEDTDSDGVPDGCDDCSDSASGATVDETGCELTAAISQIGSNLPAEFSISQNFPNPFNPVTSITFDVAEMDEVSLIVYDLTGKEVATLVSGTYTPGTYKVEWNAVNNAGDGIVSGMYIYRYISSEKAITRKMLYLK